MLLKTMSRKKEINLLERERENTTKNRFLQRTLATFSIAGVLLTAQLIGLLDQKNTIAQAQSAGRPYVVFVNGYQDCCAWGRYTDGRPAPLMEIVFDSLPANSEIISVPWDSFNNGASQRSNTSNDALFLNQAEEALDALDPKRPLILIGHSFGGDSIVSLLPRIDRQIQFVGVIDPTAAGGLREPITRRSIPSNVDYFFNRWQRNGLGGDNVVPFDSRLIDGRIGSCNATRNCDQTAQNLARRRNGDTIRVSCGSWEVTCDGYEPWPGGSNGTKSRRLEHNNMPQDEYLQVQMASIIQQALTNFSPQLPNSYLSNPVFDPDFYLLTYGDLRAAYGQQNPDGARQHWTLHGLSEARRSSPAFDVRYYRDIHPDLVEVFGEDYYGLVDHWLRHGIQEGRRSSLVFDVKYYLDKYPDLQQAFGRTNYSAAVDHWLSNGISEGRQGSSEFAPQFYLSSNPDVADVYGASNYRGAISHYLEFGISEGRNGAP